MNLKQLFCGISTTGHKNGSIIGMEKIEGNFYRVVMKCSKCGVYFAESKQIKQIFSVGPDSNGHIKIEFDIPLRSGKRDFCYISDIRPTTLINFEELAKILVIHSESLHKKIENQKSIIYSLKEESTTHKYVLPESCMKSKYRDVYQSMLNIFESAIALDLNTIINVEKGSHIDIVKDVALFTNSAIVHAKNRFWLYDRLKWSNDKQGMITYSKREGRKK